MLRNPNSTALAIAMTVSAAMAVAFAWAQPKESSAPASLAVRQARLQLRMAEANLQKVRKMNQRVANLVSAEVVGEYREDAETAKARLAATEREEGDNPFSVWIRTAEAAVKIAEDRLKGAQAVSKKVSGVFDDLDVERMQIRVELARLRLERGKALADQPRETQLQWQISVLADEVQRLREQSRHAPPSGGVGPSYPLWWCY